MSETIQRRNTPQRKVILEELCALKTHPTAAQLYEIVRLQFPRISLGTVYRNLEVLMHEGNIQKFDSVGGETRFDGNPLPHYHVRCTECGALQDLHTITPGSIVPQPREMEGFLISGHRLEYMGICPDCQKKGIEPGKMNFPSN